MIITTNITMDLSRRGPTQVISAVQDDRCSRALAMVLTSGGVAWEPPEGTTVQVRYRKPDGTGGNYDTLPDGTPAWTIDGNTLTVSLAPQVCTVPGRVTLTAALVQGETQLHTFVVGIDVQPNPGLQVTSENYYKIAGALPDSGWEPDKYLGTDGEGKVVTKTAPAGGLTLLGTVRPGQYLRVESVDENGNITVEAVELDAKAIVAYLYNGVRLPKLPDWDKTVHPFAYIGKMAGEYFLIMLKTEAAGTSIIVTDGLVSGGSRLLYAVVNGVWVKQTEAQSMSYIAVWCDHDIVDADDVVKLQASEPIPVYE